ncbi:MAG: hypothetical protein RSA63_01235 [Eubacterium sp.]
MNAKDEFDFMLNSPGMFLNVEGKSMEQRMNEVKLKNEDEIRDSVAKGQLKEAGKDVLSLLTGGIGDIAIELIEWQEKLEGKMDEAKVYYLLGCFFSRVDNHDKAIKMLIDTISNPYGNTLVNKLFKIVKDYPNDSDYSRRLAMALVHICESENLKELFGFYKFNLSLIEKLTPQSLAILSDNKNWPDFHMSVMVSNSGVVQGDFETEFAKAYAMKKGIEGNDLFQRIKYPIMELKNEGQIKAVSAGNQANVVLTDIGLELASFISLE